MMMVMMTTMAMMMTTMMMTTTMMMAMTMMTLQTYEDIRTRRRTQLPYRVKTTAPEVNFLNVFNYLKIKT